VSLGLTNVRFIHIEDEFGLIVIVDFTELIEELVNVLLALVIDQRASNGACALKGETVSVHKAMEPTKRCGEFVSA
jgi:hypothetical protein